MILNYSVGDYVLIRAKVEQIHIDADDGTKYRLIVNADDDMFINPKRVPVAVRESEIVCGWIGGDEDE